MKKVGFIDYYLDEWHAENYPAWIERASVGAVKVACAYGKIDSPTGRSNAEWAAKHGVELLPTIEKVVEQSDYIVVLAPDHPQFHEELSQLPLRSGKPTYIDKTFAPDRKTAQRLFALAREHGTPMYSSSALRFAAEYTEASREGVATICSVGPGAFDQYSIHQIEPVLSLMGGRPSRVMSIGTPNSPALLIGFADGRQASIHLMGWECPFGMVVQYSSGQTRTMKPVSNYFDAFVRRMLAFFETGVPEVDPDETVAVITVIEYGLQAIQTPYEWVQLP